MNAHDIKDQIFKDKHLESGQIVLGLEGLNIAVKSNSGSLLEELSYYFEHVLTPMPGALTIYAFQDDPQDLGLSFQDWKREPQKTGRKDAICDLEDARLIQKVRTGMLFLQSQKDLIAVGHCLENDNQVINFINAQYMNHLQNNGHLICHAAALCKQDQALGIAGISGGGKSTLMLDLLEDEAIRYITNDRLFLKDIEGQIRATGIPKLPRVNPGTLLNNSHLRDLLDSAQIKEFEAMSRQELWDVEEKYDVIISECFGEDRIQPSAPLSAFLILNWQRDGQDPCHIEKINIQDRPDLLACVMKSPGPFYQYGDGRFYQQEDQLDPAPYLEILSHVDVYEARGTVDFEAAKSFCKQTILGE